ncbi:DeoR/GlpR family DNA-binding transcription regulator [Paenibacillus hunanensis]|uniref:DeoR/GlpR family DNA-binding transcription regulator n=1 Tax=Paenibacillus hunanensis TaxID=539262 RepID=UPI0020276770|nr:DeoR/GlpR family DNA-binding transcription regulator [Paenibacillus hunanensis]MCL9662389.1 DeoR/GlpR family DNA-binding transcription regulator [Paenibacillus hunanensis]
MSALKRHERIMEILIASQEITVGELSDTLHVTGKTIREDLAKLEEMGLLVRVHGGAVLAQNDQYGILSGQGTNTKHMPEKSEIAERALHYIQPGDIIALDGGSTTLEIARRLPSMPLTVVTNDLFILSELARKEQVRLVVPGGERNRNMLVSSQAIEYVRGLNIHKAFVSSTALHPEFGLSIYTGDLVPFKKALVDTAQKVYGVIDHQKFGQFALWTFATCSELDMIITDSGLSSEHAKHFQQAGIPLDQAGA